MRRYCEATGYLGIASVVAKIPAQLLKSGPILRMPTLWVSQPIEIRSTPVAAICGAVAGVMRPEASVIARPATIATASVSVAESILSRSTASTPQSSASRS
jgi:hypothetical protein